MKTTVFIYSLLHDRPPERFEKQTRSPTQTLNSDQTDLLWPKHETALEEVKRLRMPCLCWRVCISNHRWAHSSSIAWFHSSPAGCRAACVLTTAHGAGCGESPIDTQSERNAKRTNHPSVHLATLSLPWPCMPSIAGLHAVMGNKHSVKA